MDISANLIKDCTSVYLGTKQGHGKGSALRVIQHALVLSSVFKAGLCYDQDIPTSEHPICRIARHRESTSQPLRLAVLRGHIINVALKANVSDLFSKSKGWRCNSDGMMTRTIHSTGGVSLAL